MPLQKPSSKFRLADSPSIPHNRITLKAGLNNFLAMASRGNPNTPSKSRRVANRAKVQRRNAVNKVSKNARGTRNSTVLAPTSGPLAPLSGKKARKVEKAQNHARQRALEKAIQEGEVEMTGW